MATIKRFEDLQIWQDARALSLKVYGLTQPEPFAKDFRFCSQIRAAAGSVMDNIAEGFERGSQLEFFNFLSFSKGSAGEVGSQLYRAIDFKYIGLEVATNLIKEYEELASKIAGFISYLNKSDYKGQKFKDR
ncbi:four helix bundle protein [Flavisolibacter tropicus]|uniref:30S ribosomal protein S23 n=1 Tax=Flavisolibacter tropicus TaxID=1492898 RepID=A0A172TSW0_9BACT|nr:four helix bundle protein [Flavisolibacter tropicus]ANE49867.1 30S ribosomal protein S23 [Flavisolibacter tropicus]